MFYAKRPIWVGVISVLAIIFAVGLSIWCSTDFDKMPLNAFIMIEIIFASFAVPAIIFFLNVMFGYIQADDKGVIFYNGFGRKKFYTYYEMTYCSLSAGKSEVYLFVYDREGVLLFKCDLEAKKLREFLIEKGIKIVSPEPVFPPPEMKKGRADMKRREYGKIMAVNALFAAIFLGFAFMFIPVDNGIELPIWFFWSLFAMGMIPSIIFVIFAMKRRLLKLDAEEKETE